MFREHGLRDGLRSTIIVPRNKWQGPDLGLRLALTVSSLVWLFFDSFAGPFVAPIPLRPISTIDRPSSPSVLCDVYTSLIPTISFVRRPYLASCSTPFCISPPCSPPASVLPLQVCHQALDLSVLLVPHPVNIQREKGEGKVQITTTNTLVNRPRKRLFPGTTLANTLSDRPQRPRTH